MKILGILILLVFVSACDNQTNEVDLFSAKDLECIDEEGMSHEECNGVDDTLLELSITGSTEVNVASSTTDLEFGGECNEGGFLFDEQAGTANRVVWQIVDVNQRVVQDSTIEQLNSTCINGKFSVYVRLPFAGLRVAADANSQRMEHELQIRMEGIKEGQIYRNPSMAEKVILLRPLL